ncbi:GGDEF domain-containing protein [Idiomarina sp. UBA3162]|uniref:GGDEF domain-containing protein n=1 Tax=Idiomarina sp. UBA3162 TaxID=1946641 RepID=UPI000C919BCA|nr:diguanylate cyclase [Idiomarina sp. UBA3162]MAD54304.1 GGDEF domain-containing protein [Idiomarinaceae bacterium]
MNQSNSAEEKLAILEKRLNQTIQSRKQLEDEYQHDWTHFSNMLTQLSYACGGLDQNLDNSLTKLRGLLQRNSGMEQLKPVMAESETHIQSVTHRVQRNLKASHEATLEAIGWLKKQPALNQDARAELQRIIDSTESQHVSVMHYIPLLISLLKYCQRLGHDIVEQPKQDYSQEQKIVVKLIAQLEFTGSTEQQLIALTRQFKGKLTATELLTAMVSLLETIIDGVNLERQSAQNFLLEISQTLGAVQGTLSQSVQERSHYEKDNSTLNQQLKSNVDELNASVQGAQHLETLKQEVAGHLNRLNETLQEKLALENKERQQFERTTSKLTSKLTHFEQQVHHYKQKLAEQKFKSLQDSLTKLPNRAALEERMSVEEQRFKRTREPLSIAVLDIDFFKRINDNFGHSAGDKTLQVIASMLRKAVNEADFVCRYGGEEFVILFPNTSITDAQARLEKACDRIRNIPFKFRSEDIRITVSVGIAELQQVNQSLTSLFDAADKALYEAKRTGRNKIVLASAVSD